MARPTLRPATVYFGIVFTVGFCLGTIRVLLVVPRVGARTAELLELPLMVAASLFAARLVGRRFPAVLARRSAALAVGGVALGLLLLAETIVGVLSGRRSFHELFLAHDPVSGTAYYASLVLFGLFPWLLARPSRPAFDPGRR